ncbi:major histocompatibility complex class I-related gene protein-like [Sardina pilchardus]|uniref:major histocompatibility complex class I-related gene protein-like n=1 Tax=Sardina pilchardus TaxID=27697 RepID=UPI002E1566EA
MSCCYATGSHSLWMKATYIKGSSSFPEFSAYGMLDDIVFGYYDSIESKIIHKYINQASNSSLDEEDMNYVKYLIRHNHGRMKDRASYLSNYFNHTNDTYTLQRSSACELLDNDEPGWMTHSDVYNGQAVEEAYNDVDDNTLHFKVKWTNTDSALWTLTSGRVSLYSCIKFLKKHLVIEKNRVLKKVKPGVTFLPREKMDSTDVLLTCLATGFYPRHINLTLLRDGQSVSDHQVTGGELLPNGDETYQMRKSLEVSTEELQHHHYTCTAEHLSVDNKLDIDLGMTGF